MSDAALKTLMTAMDFAVFERTDDGAFQAITDTPPWFPRLASGTFPFLGHILDEANAFWMSGKPGRQNWGPAAEVDERGREFHYLVSAVALDGRQYLLFQLDRASERLREVLQVARDHKLQDDRARQARTALVSGLRERSDEIDAVLGRLTSGPQMPGQRDLFDKLSSACDALVTAAERLA
jgi:hypothetical protein